MPSSSRTMPSRNSCRCAVEAHHLALPKPEVVPVRHQEVVDVVHVGIDASRRDFVQQRFPQMRRVVIDERYRRLPAAPERVAERVASGRPAAPPPTITT